MRKIWLILLLFALLFIIPKQASADSTIYVFYAGAPGPVTTALTLAKNLKLVTNISQADVLVLNNDLPNIDAIHNRLHQGAGLVLLLGPNLSSVQLESLLGEPVSLAIKEDPLSLNVASDSNDPITTDIIWTSSPQVRQRYMLSGSSFTPDVVGYEDGSLILGSKTIGTGKAYLFTAFLNQYNPQFQE